MAIIIQFPVRGARRVPAMIDALLKVDRSTLVWLDLPAIHAACRAAVPDCTQDELEDAYLAAVDVLCPEMPPATTRTVVSGEPRP